MLFEKNISKLIFLFIIISNIFSATDLPPEAPRYTPKSGEIVAGLYTGDYKIGYKNQLLMTIDDILFDKNLEIQLDILKKHKIKAVFFLVGRYLTDQKATHTKELLQRIIAEGHVLGNHTWAHENATHRTPEQFLASLQRTQKQLDAVLGYHYPLKYYRPPYGSYSQANLKVLADNGYYFIHWNITPYDWEMNYSGAARRSPQSVIEQTLKDARIMHGGIILLHTFPRTTAIFEKIIITLKQSPNKYTFVDINELLRNKYFQPSS